MSSIFERFARSGGGSTPLGVVAGTKGTDNPAELQEVKITSKKAPPRSAEGTVVRAPATNTDRAATGPQQSLSKSPYDFRTLKYPTNLGDQSARHWIKFTPNVQNASRYEVKKEAGGAAGIADSNRFNIGGQLASSPNPLSGSAGVIGGATGVLLGAGKVANALENAQTLQGLAAGVVGGVVVGAVGGAFAGEAISSIALGRKTRRAAASICLYMPDTVNVTSVNDYDQVSLTQALGLAGLAAQAGGSIVDEFKKQLESGTPSLGGLVGTAAGRELIGLGAEKTGAFGQGITDVLLFSAGYAQNPQVELLFKTIQNREFLFDFKFVPRNPAESAEIIDIIKQFRFFSAPEIAAQGQGRYFIPPSEFDIDFMIGASRNDKIPRISTCVLQGVDVNYGSAGQWTAFPDGMPVEISMQLRFKEVEIMHKELIRQGF